MKLWCEVPGGSGNCKTAEVPAADGTRCGNNKVFQLNDLNVQLAILKTSRGLGTNQNYYENQSGSKKGSVT